MENAVNILVNVVRNQNPVMLVLYGLSVLCLAAVIDRIVFWLTMAARYRPVPPRAILQNKAGSELLKNQLSGKKHRHYGQEMLLAAMQSPRHPGHLKQTASEQIEKMSARIGMLDLIAKIAPLVGILGTVLGMAVSFGGISQIVTASPAVISLGISVALQTTAWGLVVSLFASLAAAIFRKFTRNATLKIGRIICEFGHTQS